MYLKSLEISGFKSFAKKTALDFNTPITAIVGPNGSGKSNTAEAFRFVLGEQSIKSMRGKRTEDLIWNGSPELARQNRASVKLVFDNRTLSNGERLFTLDFDEIVLERAIYRDASSEYFLNGNQVRLRDIVETLSGAHIGASGHHIISQGEADRILNASVRERREMIEDALGLKIYQWKREESERKLEKSQENMKQVEILRKEIAPHLTFLKKQVEKIEKARVLKEEIRTLYKEYFRREHEYISFTKQQIDEEERLPKSELEELDRALLRAKQTLSLVQGKDERTDAVIALEEKLRNFRNSREEVSREIGRIEGETAGAKRMLDLDRSGEKGEAVIPFFEIERISREVETAFEGKETDGDYLRRVLEKLRNALSALLARYRSRKPAFEELEKEVILLEERKKRLEEKLRHVEEEEKTVLEEERKLRTDIEKEKDSSRDAEKEMFKIMARQNELRGVLNSLRVRLHECEHLEGDFKRELTEGVLLVGREILDYEKCEVRDESGTVLNPRTMVSEERSEQEERRRRIERLKIRIEESGAGSGTDIVKEYDEAKERDMFLTRELEDLKKGVETLKTLITELEEKIEKEFQIGIEKINKQFQDFFVLMFGGGTAKLVVHIPERKVRREVDDVLLEDEQALRAIAEEQEGERESGIEIEVNLPRKKIKGLMMLSGGERALTSIALLFAMSQVKPPPFIILDETDAALDEANSRKYGDMIENLSKYSQLILITHNRETMSRAGVIYGVTMDRSGVSKLLSIAFDDAVAVAK